MSKQEARIMNREEHVELYVRALETPPIWDDDLVCRAKESAEDLERLMAAMMPTARHLAAVYSRAGGARAEQFQEALLLIRQAVHDYQPGRAPFDHYVNFIAAKRLRAAPWPCPTLNVGAVSLEGLAANNWRHGEGDADVSCLPCMAVEDPGFKALFELPDINPQELFAGCLQELAQTNPEYADVLNALYTGGLSCKDYATTRNKSHAWARKVAERARNAARVLASKYRNARLEAA